MSERQLATEELEDRAFAVLIAAAEGRAKDVRNLLGALPRSDVEVITWTTARMCVGFMTGTDTFPPSVRDLERLVTDLRALLVQRVASRDDG